MLKPRLRFLVRGIIYDMSALTLRKSQAATSSSSEVKDWSSLVGLDTNPPPELDPKSLTTVRASDVLKSLGLDNMGSLTKRILKTGEQSEERRSRLAAKQKLEEVMGRGDSIRAKYQDKLHHKRLRAEARLEHAKFGFASPAFPFPSPHHSTLDCQAMPGLTAFLHYIEERGIVQGLLARGENSDFKAFLQKLEGFRYQQIRHLEQLNMSDEVSSFNVKSILDNICTAWDLPRQQVLLVIGGDPSSDIILQAVANMDFFICQISSSNPMQCQSGRETTDLTGNDQKEKFSLKKWFNKLAEGTLRIKDENKHKGHNLTYKDKVHYKVKNMRELKWVIEDLNGISYKRSTMLWTL